MISSFTHRLLSLFLLFQHKANEANCNLVELKRLTSETLKLQGVKFDKDINQIEFDNETWGDLILSNEIMSMMKLSVERQIHLLKNGNTPPYNKFDSTIPIIPIREMGLNGGSYITYHIITSFSVRSIQDPTKRSKIQSVFTKLNATISRCQKSFWTEDNSLDWFVLKKIHIEFKEANMSSFSCGKAPFIAFPSQKPYTIELSCFDETTISRLVLGAIGVINPLWRYDRDKYVKINWENIDDKYKYLFHKWNFDILETLSTHLSWGIGTTADPFDFSSVMLFAQNQYTKGQQHKTNIMLSWEGKKNGLIKNNSSMSKLDEKFILDITCYQPLLKGPGPECTDYDVQCLFFKEQDKCTNNDVKGQCNIACDTCVPVSSSTVVCDDKSDFCNEWKQNCQPGAKHYFYMKSYCTRTCDTCAHGPNSAKWRNSEESTSVCDNPKQSTIVSSEEECKNWCLKTKLSYCFWETSLNDGGCFGTVACIRLKNEKSIYRRFNLI